MSRALRFAAVQAAPVAAGSPLTAFREEVRGILADDPTIQCLVYPELHLFGVEGSSEEQDAQLREHAVALDAPFLQELAAIASTEGVWLVPGSIAERAADGRVYNTVPVFSPTGALVSHYRKVFLCRPDELLDPGDQFVVFDIPDVGQVGLSVCYDSWFPELSRQLAWMGADVVLNVAKTMSPERAQEIVITRANSIVNQTFTVSVNCAGPIGVGRSLIVDPEGAVLAEDPGAETAVLTQTIDFDHVRRVREHGTADAIRVWTHFSEGDPVVKLPLYDGSITAKRWDIQGPR